MVMHTFGRRPIAGGPRGRRLAGSSIVQATALRQEVEWMRQRSLTRQIPQSPHRHSNPYAATVVGTPRSTSGTRSHLGWLHRAGVLHEEVVRIMPQLGLDQL